MSSASVPETNAKMVKRPGFFGSEEDQAGDPLDEATRELIDDFCEKTPGGQERLIPLLHAVQRFQGYLPFPAQDYVASRLGLSAVQVYGVVSFYHFFSTTPRGKFQIKVCMGTACFVRGSQRLLDTLASELGMEVGDLSEDGLFNLEAVRCIGACGLAPAIMVNDDVHGDLNANKVRRLVKKLRKQAAEESEGDQEPAEEGAS